MHRRRASEHRCRQQQCKRSSELHCELHCGVELGPLRVTCLLAALPLSCGRGACAAGVGTSWSAALRMPLSCGSGGSGGSAAEGGWVVGVWECLCGIKY
eukprot:352956-Chlamydomonas_euryale.AAC.2